MRKPSDEVGEQKNKYAESRGPKVKGFGGLADFFTRYFREHVVDQSEYDHTEETVNALVEVKLVDD